MSSEITLTGSLKVSKGNLNFQKSNVQVRADMAGTHAFNSVVNVGTNAAALSLPTEIATAGAFWMRNTDATNYVEVGTGTGTNFASFLKLLPGEVAVGRLGTNVPCAKAHTLPVDLDVCVLQA